MRALGPAWVRRDGDGWKNRRGEPTGGALTEREANAMLDRLIAEYDTEQTRRDQDAEDRRLRGVTFRELVDEWLVYLKREKGAKPSTLIDYRWMIAEPGGPHRRGKGTYPGLLMAALGDRRITEITTREVSDFMRSLDDRGCKPRTVNRHRQLICAAYNYAAREDTYGLTSNPGTATTKRHEPPPAVLDFYESDEVEMIARYAAAGAHRTAHAVTHSDEETQARQREDAQDAELYRIAACTGLRLGELLALKWGDVHIDDGRVIVHRAFSARIEGPTKSWQARFVPLADDPAAALARMAQREEFTSNEEYVFCNRFGEPLNGAPLRIRFKRAAAAAGLRVLKFHALRHGAGSMVARQADPRWVQGFLGHSKLSTTERYLHAKSRPEDVKLLNRAFGDRLNAEALEITAANESTSNSR
jgi:integrase